MGTGIRPEQFDRAAAKAAGYTDAEIDAFLASQVGPRRGLVAAPPAPAAPAATPERPGLLRRTADAAIGLGRAAVTDPIGTAKTLGKGIAQTGADLAAMARDPMQAGATAQRFLAEEGGDPRRAGVRAANAASLLLPAAGRAAGLGARGIAALDIGAGAGLGAASTPDDPGVGALLGGGLTAATYAGAARNAVRGMGDVMNFDEVTRGVTNVVPPLRNVPEVAPRPTGRPITAAAGDVAKTLDEVTKALPPDVSPGAQPLAPSGPVRRIPVSETVRSGAADDVIAAEIAEGRKIALRQRLGDDPITRQMAGFTDDGVYIAGGGVEPLPRNAVPRSAFDIPLGEMLPEEALPAITKRADMPDVAPPPAPASRRAFPEGFTTGAADDVAWQQESAFTAAREQLQSATAAREKLSSSLTAARAAAAKADEALSAAATQRRAAAEAAVAKAEERLAKAPLLTKGPNAGQKPPGLVRSVELARERLEAIEPPKDVAQKADAARGRLAELEAELTRNDEQVRALRSQLENAPAPAPPPAAVPAAVTRPVASATPSSPRAEPPVAPAAAPSAAAALPEPVPPPVTPDAPPRVTPEPVPAAAAVPEAAPAPALAPVAAAPTATVDNAATGATAGGALPPADTSYLNWRTITNPDAPLGKPTLDRIQSIAARIEPELAAARGKTTMAAQYDEALKTKVIRELFDDPLTVDRQKLKNLSGAQITAVAEVLGENQRMAAMIADDVANGKLSQDDMALAMQRLDQLDNASREALLVIQDEKSQRGRDLGFLAQQARLSTDPNVWLVRAQKALGNEPMSSDIMTRVRQLAIAATDACKLGG